MNQIHGHDHMVPAGSTEHVYELAGMEDIEALLIAGKVEKCVGRSSEKKII